MTCGCGDVEDHEHEYVAWCDACGRQMNMDGSPPACLHCGECYEAPRQCHICGLEEACDE